ncbi:alpha/beta fold hydrolase [Undibacterium sp. Ji22W]|uniref:alpha/beta fold hydrolase n=1 Tax=Undibacterium sp. Ji22W TaxID=3413038 RepID=UPI003BF26754
MTTWVLLRGLMRESRHWGTFPHQLQKVAGDANIICIDFPGNGVLCEQSSLATIPEMAEYCRQQLLAKSLAPPYHVMAISLGAMVAVAWAERYPNDLNSMVLINTSLAPHNPFYQRLRPQNYPRLLRTLIFGNTHHREALVFQLTSQMHDPISARAIVDEWIHYARECPIKRRNILRQLRAASQFQAPEQAPKTPTLLLASQLDQLVDVHCSQTLAEKWQAEIKIHDHAGHDLPLDDSAWVIKAIQEWRHEILV